MERKEENGGDRAFLSREELAADYESGALQAADVKRALKKAINAGSGFFLTSYPHNLYPGPPSMVMSNQPAPLRCQPCSVLPRHIHMYAAAHLTK